MIEKLKSYAAAIAAVVIAVLSALLFRKSRQLDATQSELAHEQNTTEIKLNDQAREAARANADDLVAEYERLRRDK